MSTFSKRISASTDDAEETVSSGDVDVISSDLEVLHDAGTIEQVMGLRFQGVTIGKSATINTASIEFEVDVSHSGAVSVDIYGEDVDDAAAFAAGTASFSISGRTKTTAMVTWSVGGDGAAVNAKVSTSDISTIIQEIIDRTNWTSGNDIVIILDNPTATNYREFESYDGESAAAPILSIDYTANASPTVALNSPTDASNVSDTTPALEFTGSDGESEDIRYNIQIDTANTFDSVAGTEAVDQQNTTTGSNFGFGQFTGVRYRGQVFTCGASGKLTKIGFSRNKGTNDIKVYIDTVDGSNLPAHAVGSELYSFTIANADVIDEYGEYAVPTPVDMVAGTKYCFYLAPFSGGSYSDDYQDVRGRNVTTGGVTEITNNAGSWFTENLCFYYKTYITPYGPLLDKVSGTDAGFSGSPDNTDPFASAQAVTYTVQSALSVGTTYYWRVRGLDPSGSNSYGAFATTRSFTIVSVTTQTATVTAKARIKSTGTTKTVTAKARIKVLDVTKTVTAKARIKQAAVTQTITAKARIKQAAITKTVTAKARIKNTTNQTVTAKARIKSTGTTSTVNAKARIKNTATATVTVKARIKVTNTQTITAKAAIASAIVTYTQTVTAKARIKQVDNTKTVTVRARILVAGNIQTVQAKARIKTLANTNTVQAKARIKVLNNTQTISAKARVLSTGVTNTVSAKARIFNTYTQTVTAKARIKVADNTKTITSKARIKQLAVSQSVDAKARIKKTVTITPRYGLDFDGINDDLNIDNTFPIGQKWSIEFKLKWGYNGLPPADKGFLTTGNKQDSGPGLYIRVWGSNGKLTIYDFGSGSITSVNTHSFTQDQVYYFYFASDNVTKKAYFGVDGVVEEVPFVTDHWTSAATNMHIGEGYAGYIDGTFDEFRFSDSIRHTTSYTPSEYLTEDANTVVMLHMDEGTGNIAYDSSGNGHNATLDASTPPAWVEFGYNGISAKARIATLGVTQTISAKARIKSTQTTTVTSKARIKNTAVQTISAKARIKSTGNIATISSQARIKKLAVTQTIDAKARIKITSAQSIQAKARIKNTSEQSIDAKARIKVLDNTNTVDAKARIKSTGETVTISAKARIITTQAQTVSAKARIKQIGVTQTVTARARIVYTNTVTVSAKAKIAPGIIVTTGVFHGTGLGNRINDVDDKNQMWNKDVFITFINAPIPNPFGKSFQGVLILPGKGKVFGVKIIE